MLRVRLHIFLTVSSSISEPSSQIVDVPLRLGAIMIRGILKVSPRLHLHGIVDVHMILVNHHLP
jgi:hypothetical protein